MNQILNSSIESSHELDKLWYNQHRKMETDSMWFEIVDLATFEVKTWKK